MTLEEFSKMDKCPWCEAEVRDKFNFVCGSIRPSYVTPSPMQADSCRIGILKQCLKSIIETYPQRKMMLPYIRQAKELVKP